MLWLQKGICMNYVIQVNDSKFPNDMFEKEWTDVYEFAVASFLKALC